MKAQPVKSAAQDAPPCPSWCKHCEVTPSEVCHLSADTGITTRDATYDIALVRADELAFPQEWDRPPEVQLSVESTTLAADRAGHPMHVSTAMSLDELAQLIDALTGVLWQARLLGGSR